MNNKTQRLIIIKKLIQKSKFSSQEELQEILKSKGFDYTQATLSRDLKFLKIIKIPDSDGTYYFSLQDTTKRHATANPSLSGFLSIDFSINIGVVKTISGHANSIASTIDEAEIYEVLGTVAGDDTIIIISREGAKKNDIINALKVSFPELTKIIQ